MAEYNFISDEELENIFLDEEIENAVIKHIEDSLEFDRNGRAIDWNYWCKLDNIAAAQAARLTNFIDPILWPDITYSWGDIPKDLTQTIQRLEQRFESRRKLWSLSYLIEELGKNAPISMIQAIDNLPQPETKAVDVGAGGQDGTNQADSKVIQANSNEFEFSGLLHKPSGVDDWFEVIDVMTKAFCEENNVMPTKAQAWARLCTNPPINYRIKSNNNQSLEMPGVAKAFNKRSFDRRWTKYTAKSNPFKPI